ncbi:hypothetical protein B0O80DRAFT_502903 [Mortierella sp. GBAus27b]|nr:hypothetical protein B0O80DRAFT_502903 [Mortierella sp. GBAus27b]
MAIREVDVSTESDPTPSRLDDSRGTTDLTTPTLSSKSKQLIRAFLQDGQSHSDEDEHSANVLSAFLSNRRIPSSPLLPKVRPQRRTRSVNPVSRPLELDSPYSVAAGKDSVDKTSTEYPSVRSQDKDEDEVSVRRQDEQSHSNTGISTNHADNPYSVAQKSTNLDRDGLHVRTPTRSRTSERNLGAVLEDPERTSPHDLFTFLKKRRGPMFGRQWPTSLLLSCPTKDITKTPICNVVSQENEDVLGDGDGSTLVGIPRRMARQSHHFKRSTGSGSSLEQWKYTAMMNYPTMKPPMLLEENDDANELLLSTPTSGEQGFETPRRAQPTLLRDLYDESFSEVHEDSDTPSFKQTFKRTAAFTDDEDHVDEDEHGGSSTNKRLRCLDLNTSKYIPMTPIVQESTPDLFFTPQKPIGIRIPRRPELPRGGLPMFSTHDNSYSPSDRNQQNHCHLVGSLE